MSINVESARNLVLEGLNNLQKTADKSPVRVLKSNIERDSKRLDNIISNIRNDIQKGQGEVLASFLHDLETIQHKVTEIRQNIADAPKELKQLYEKTIEVFNSQSFADIQRDRLELLKMVTDGKSALGSVNKKVSELLAIWKKNLSTPEASPFVTQLEWMANMTKVLSQTDIDDGLAKDALGKMHSVLSNSLQEVSAVQERELKSEHKPPPLVVQIHDMQALEALIESTSKEFGISKTDILVAFDFDGTICARPEGSSFGQAPAALREGTSDFLKYLKEQNIKSVIDTAALGGGLGSIVTQLAKLNQPFENSPFYDSFFKIGQKKGDSFECITTVLGGGQGATVAQCYGYVSAGYDKPFALEHLWRSHGTWKPKLIVFVDDGVINVKNMYEHFHQGSIPIYSIYFPQMKQGAIHDEEPGAVESRTDLLTALNIQDFQTAEEALKRLRGAPGP